MTKIERAGALFFSISALVLLSINFYKLYIANTKPVPTAGGTYEEAIVGDLKYLNPVTAQSDTDQAVSGLIFSGLVQVSDQNDIVPDIADHWETSSEGQKYTFYLKKNVKFSDGVPLTANDIAYTINNIKDPATKSPLYTSWSGVTVSVIDDYTVEFDLPKVYGPFIYNCTFGILPSHLTPDEFSKNVTGSGPYELQKSTNTKDGSLTASLELSRNDGYYGPASNIDQIKLDFYSTKDEAVTAFQNDIKINAISGAAVDGVRNMSYKSGRQLGLIANVGSDKMKDITNRQNFFTSQKFSKPIELSLVTLDEDYQRTEAEALTEKYKSLNVKLNVQYLTPLQFPDAIKSRKYDLLLYGFDFGYDRDPYTFWHSSQIATGMNFAGWSDKNSDIMLEDARMITDPAQRNAKYDDFFANVVNKQYLAEFFDPISYNFFVRDSVKNIKPITGNQVYSRYDNIISWYVAEKRVPK